MAHYRITLVCGQEEMCASLQDILHPHSLFPSVISRAATKTLPSLKRSDLIIVGSAHRTAANGITDIERIRKAGLRSPVILVTRYSSEKRAIAALRAGANDYVRWPCPGAELLNRITSHLPAQPVVSEEDSQSRIIGRARPIREILQELPAIARSDCNVLITGESGTGKELVAEEIHSRSARTGQPFVSINCAALPEGLVESELFGHSRGAFTGAHASYQGKLRLAGKGTVFFDEIGDMPAGAQAKLLRVIEGKGFYPVGGASSVCADFRVVAATNRDPRQMIRERQFRDDLFYRLAVVPIELPPLRTRLEDIPHLLYHFVQEFNRRFGLRVHGFTDRAVQDLQAYDWPGNVRELKNTVEAAFINLGPDPAAYIDLPRHFRNLLAGSNGRSACERQRMLRILHECRWNKSRAAEKLSWSRMTLYRKMIKHSITTKPADPDGE